MCKSFWHTPKISQKFAESEILVCSTMVRMKTVLGIIQL